MQFHLLILSLLLQATAACFALYAMYQDHSTRRETRRLDEQRLGENLRTLFDNELR